MRVDYIVQQLGGVVWRNNSGVAHEKHRPVRFGVGNISARLNAIWKSSDWIGLLPDGRFLALEEKPAGWKYSGTKHEKAQLNFLIDVTKYNGVGAFVTCEDDIKSLFARVMR
jgi:hypothetical protein